MLAQGRDQATSVRVFNSADYAGHALFSDDLFNKRKMAIEYLSHNAT
jgi:hypothetical protein